MKNIISQRAFKVIGFDNGYNFDKEFTLNWLFSEEDSELLYTLQELYIDQILDLEVKKVIQCKSSRDNSDNSQILIMRIN